MIIEHYGNQYKDIRLDYAIEKEPLGTGGGLLLAMQKVEGNSVIALNGDTFFMIDFKKFVDIHRAKESKLSIILREVVDVSRYGSVERDEHNVISGFFEKSKKKGTGYINGGIYLINKAFFLSHNLPEKFSLEKDFFEKVYKESKIYGILCRQYFIDIGIPADYKRAQHDFTQFEYF
jgi:D-glycero-alpha-D-manno-heptose 1-phosphate guanylyltransferase